VKKKHTQKRRAKKIYFKRQEIVPSFSMRRIYFYFQWKLFGRVFTDKPPLFIAFELNCVPPQHTQRNSLSSFFEHEPHPSSDRQKMRALSSFCKQILVQNFTSTCLLKMPLSKISRSVGKNDIHKKMDLDFCIKTTQNQTRSHSFLVIRPYRNFSFIFMPSCFVMCHPTTCLTAP
jgi:hypothetical protein